MPWQRFGTCALWLSMAPSQGFAQSDGGMEPATPVVAAARSGNSARTQRSPRRKSPRWWRQPRSRWGWRSDGGQRDQPLLPRAASKFILLLYEDEAFRHPVAERSEQHLVGEYRAWAQALRDEGHLLAAEKLAVDGRLVARVRDELQVSPDVSATPEGVVAGFFVVTARDYDDAVAAASRSPHLRYGGRIAVRCIEPT